MQAKWKAIFKIYVAYFKLPIIVVQKSFMTLVTDQSFLK